MAAHPGSDRRSSCIESGPSQVKLIRDSAGAWYLLGFRGDPGGDPNGPDFVDVYGVRFHPIAITTRLFSVHVFFRPGDTSFTSTSTHHVERSGRLLLSSSFTGGPKTRDPATPATSHASTNALQPNRPRCPRHVGPCLGG